MSQSMRGEPKHGRCRRLRKRVGRRGTALIILGIIYLNSGLPLLLASPPDAFKIFALRLWAGAFVAAGLSAFVCAFRPKPRGDRFAFIALMLVGWLWTANCLLLFILHFVNPAIPNLLSSAFGTAPLMVLVGVLAGWPEPPEPANLDLNDLSDQLKDER